MNLHRTFTATILVVALSIVTPLSAQTDSPNLQDVEARWRTAMEQLAGRAETHSEMLESVGTALENVRQAPERVEAMISGMQELIDDLGEDSEVAQVSVEIRRLSIETLGILRSRDNPDADLIEIVEGVLARQDTRDSDRTQLLSLARNQLRELERNRESISDAVAVLSLEEADRRLAQYYEQIGEILSNVTDFIEATTGDPQDTPDAP